MSDVPFGLAYHLKRPRTIKKKRSHVSCPSLLGGFGKDLLGDVADHKFQNLMWSSRELFLHGDLAIISSCVVKLGSKCQRKGVSKSILR
jgi:hypothetical protein